MACGRIHATAPTHYTDLDHWVSLARTLERGLFDGLFLADILGVYDVFHRTSPMPRSAMRCRSR